MKKENQEAGREEKGTEVNIMWMSGRRVEWDGRGRKKTGTKTDELNKKKKQVGKEEKGRKQLR